MALFGRLFGRKPREAADPSEHPEDPSHVDDQPSNQQGIESGPQDSFGEPAPAGYLDLGALYVPRMPGLQLRGKFEKGRETLSRMLLVLGKTGVTASVAAAPKSGGAWPELADQIETSIVAAGGQVSRVDGRYGEELDAKVAGVLPDGTKGFTPLRIVGIEGPRWLVRLDIQGSAISGDAEARETVDELIEQLIVNRGSEPKIRFELLPFQLPQEAVDGPN